MTNKTNPNTVVYLIQVTGTAFFKIGFTSDIHFRLASLKAANPMPLEVVATTRGARKLEGRFHRRFQLQRVRGEWFELSEDDVAAVRAVMDGDVEMETGRWMSPALGPNRTLCRCESCGRNVQAHHRFEPLRKRGNRIVVARHSDCDDVYGRTLHVEGDDLQCG